MSDMQQIAQLHSATKQSPNNKASSDTDDDIIISSALLIASTLYQTRQVNVRIESVGEIQQHTSGSQLSDRVRN